MSHHILIAVSTSRYSRQLVAEALEVAAGLSSPTEPVVFDILYVMEREALAEVGRRISREGFLGVSLQDDILEALGAEHHRLATRRIAQIREAAAQRGYTSTVTEVEGLFAEAVLAHAEAHPCDVILITRADRPFISRLLFGSEADRITRLARRDGLGEVLIPEG